MLKGELTPFKYSELFFYSFGDRMKNEDEKDKIVAKHDALIRANFKLTLNQSRLILALIAKIHPDDRNFHRYSLKISDLYRMLGLNKKKVATRELIFKNILNGLQKNLIEIITRDQGRDILRTPAWIESPEFDFGRDQITLRVSESLRPYLLQLKERGRFASYRLADVSSFRCEYSIRFLELCRNYEPRADFHDFTRRNRYVKREIFQLPELKKMLGILSNEYARPYNFKTKVLARARAEVNKHTASYFEFAMIKRGREVTAVELLIYGPAVARERIVLSPVQASQVNQAHKLGCSLWFATRFVVEYNHKEDEVWQALMAVEEYSQWLEAKGRRLKYPSSTLKKSFFEGWQSRRWLERRERQLEEAEKSAREEQAQTLRRTLRSLKRRREATEAEQEERWMSEEKRQNLKHEKRLNQWALEYEGIETAGWMIDFVLDTLPADEFRELSKENLRDLRGAVAGFVADGSRTFREIHDLTFNLILGIVLPGVEAV